MGDGSMHYAITALWTAARYELPVVWDNHQRRLQDRRTQIAARPGYFRQPPKSIGRVTPVTYRDSSEAKNSTPLLTSIGSTHGTGMV
jgi:hypothetical protein